MPDFVIKTDPEKNIVFTSDKLGEESVTVTLKLTNTAPKDVIYKVKCTSNEMFRIRPPMGILSHMKCENVRLVFNSGKAIPENRKHYFAIYYIFKPEDEAAANKNARELWGEHTGNPEGTRRLYVEFKKEKPTDAPGAVDGAAAASGAAATPEAGKEGGEGGGTVAAPAEGSTPPADSGTAVAAASTGAAALAEGGNAGAAPAAEGEKKEGEEGASAAGSGAAAPAEGGAEAGAAAAGGGEEGEKKE